MRRAIAAAQSCRPWLWSPPIALSLSVVPPHSVPLALPRRQMCRCHCCDLLPHLRLCRFGAPRQVWAHRLPSGGLLRPYPPARVRPAHRAQTPPRAIPHNPSTPTPLHLHRLRRRHTAPASRVPRAVLAALARRRAVAVLRLPGAPLPFLLSGAHSCVPDTPRPPPTHTPAFLVFDLSRPSHAFCGYTAFAPGLQGPPCPLYTLAWLLFGICR